MPLQHPVLQRERLLTELLIYADISSHSESGAPTAGTGERHHFHSPTHFKPFYIPVFAFFRFKAADLTLLYNVSAGCLFSLSLNENAADAYFGFSGYYHVRGEKADS